MSRRSPRRNAVTPRSIRQVGRQARRSEALLARAKELFREAHTDGAVMRSLSDLDARENLSFSSQPPLSHSSLSSSSLRSVSCASLVGLCMNGSSPRTSPRLVTPPSTRTSLDAAAQCFAPVRRPSPRSVLDGDATQHQSPRQQSAGSFFFRVRHLSGDRSDLLAEVEQLAAEGAARTSVSASRFSAPMYSRPFNVWSESPALVPVTSTPSTSLPVMKLEKFDDTESLLFCDE
eukprot:CAMPEP_0183330800 /NCGR_PEP_ID=MMETSP0164_2-20130417/219_1 /TAXON_ID=221442 /ORGANISM="Coccolithus pelagicus ssp braarudi, Strain PLY182g" /LENGTH=232 /DNA_ID=CAMNT_0025499091 /DNA_START=44 /DNA_END=742 /DNA_ORIENTATION=+